MLLYSRGYIWYTEICYNLKNIHYKLYILSPSINANRSQRQLDTYNSFKISSKKNFPMGREFFSPSKFSNKRSRSVSPPKKPSSEPKKCLFYL